MIGAPSSFKAAAAPQGAEQLVPGKIITELERRHHNEIEEVSGNQPSARTADGASYLVNFRTTDGIRNRVAKARQETNLRLHSKGIRGLGTAESGKQPRTGYLGKESYPCLMLILASSPRAVSVDSY
jgi:hypothetical protein